MGKETKGAPINPSRSAKGEKRATHIKQGRCRHLKNGVNMDVNELPGRRNGEQYLYLSGYAIPT